jgi:hypothetical protein
LPEKGDLIAIEGGAIHTFKASPLATKLAAWSDVWYEPGTYFIVLDIIRHSHIVPEEKGSTWHVLDGSRDRLLNIKFVRWQLVK